MTGDLPMRLAVIVHSPQVIAAEHGRERAIERKNFQAVAGKVEVANDLGAQQRDDVRADGKLESGKNFFRDRCPAKHMPPLQDEHFLPRARKIGGVSEAVVASANHDDVVCVSH